MPAQDPDYADSNFDPRRGVGGPTVINETDIPTETIIQAMQEQYPDLAWQSGGDWHNNGSRHQGIFQRDRYITPRGVFQEMRVAQEAAELDDVVSGVIDTTEDLAINRVVIETDDEDEDDVWNQILQEIDLEGRMRELWREIFVTSNSYAAVLMGRKADGYKLRGKSGTGVKRKKTYNNLIVPLAMSVLDPLQIVPVGNFMFGQERLAYIASPAQTDVIHRTLAGANSSDLVFKQLIEDFYPIDPTERILLTQITGDQVPMDRLFLMNQNRVFRVTSTRPAYERFANVRMKSIFELLDMKAQLRQSDRAHLLGATNFILLVKKGTDDKPAMPGEVAALAQQMNNAAKIPVIIGDHRISIEIITPKLDHTLSPEKYNSLDSRITSRLYQIFASGGYQSGSAQDDSIKLIRVVTRGMEARRNIIRNAIMKYVIMPTFRANDQLTSEPRLRFYPSRITMDFDPNVALYLQDSRALGDLSRHTALAELDIEEENEAMWRKREKEKYDDFFVPPAIQYAPDPVAAAPASGAPASSPVKKAPAKKAGAKAPKQPTNTKGAGRRGGGNSNGGGTNSASPKSGPPRGPAKSSLRAKLEAEGAVEPRNESPSDDT